MPKTYPTTEEISAIWFRHFATSENIDVTNFVRNIIDDQWQKWEQDETDRTRSIEKTTLLTAKTVLENTILSELNDRSPQVATAIRDASVRWFENYINLAHPEPAIPEAPVETATRRVFEAIATYGVDVLRTKDLAPRKELIDAINALVATATETK